jgi:hypothetical protein
MKKLRDALNQFSDLLLTIIILILPVAFVLLPAGAAYHAFIAGETAIGVMDSLCTIGYVVIAILFYYDLLDPGYEL